MQSAQPAASRRKQPRTARLHQARPCQALGVGRNQKPSRETSPGSNWFKTRRQAAEWFTAAVLLGAKSPIYYAMHHRCY